MRRWPLALLLATVLTTGLAAPVAAEPVPAPSADVWPYSVLPGFDPLRASATPAVLVNAPRDLNVTYTVDGETRTLQSYLDRTAQGFVVLDGNKIVKEWYAGGYTKNSLFQSWSMAKSFTSSAVGVALAEGDIASIDDTVAKYVPELGASAFGNVSLRDLLRMSSGMNWNESIDNVPLHVGVSMGWSSTPQYARTLKAGWKPGSRFNYNSVNTAVLALVVQRATGVPFHRYMQAKIWGPSGMSSTAYVGNDSHGNGLGYCCIYATGRDFARFGKMMLDGGTVAARRVLPTSWVTASTSPSGVSPGYGLQWWIDGNEGFYASGFGDQKIYVSTRHRVVIVRTTFLNGESGETLAALRAVAAEVARTR